MIIDSDLQNVRTWKTEIANVGGKQPPDAYGIDQSVSGYARFFTQGKPYSNILFALPRPILPNTGYLQLKSTLTVDSLTSTYAQALEFDTRVSVGKLNYNFSSQINYAERGMLQISAANGDWVDTGFAIGRLAPLVPHTLDYSYYFDTTTKKYSFLYLVLDGKRYVIPPKFQNLAPTSLDWEDTCNLQVQLDLGSMAGSFSHLMTDVRYVWL